MRDAGRRMRRAARPLLTAVLLLAVGACGSSSSDSPPASPTPAPTPVPTLAGPSAIEPMLLAPGVRATSVSPRQWIAITVGPIESVTIIVLPPDAGPDAGPLPVPGCPLFARPDGCAVRGGIESVGGSDWTAGYSWVQLPSFATPFPTAFGPDGEVRLITDCCSSDNFVSQVVPVPGARLIGAITAPEDGARRGIVWRQAGREWERLPSGDFAVGPLPFAADASFTIVGEGGEKRTPVAWRPVGDAFELVVLPLADGDVAGSAVAIEDGRIAGFSGRSGALRAVVWPAPEADATPVLLPLLADTVSCRATALSAGRVAGICLDDADRAHALLWAPHEDGPSWTVTALLLPAAGDVAASVSGLSGDLAVGWTIAADGTTRAVAWRVP